MGLIARALEASGIPTLCLTSAWSITASVNPPRACFLDFPLGHTAGPPDRPDEQREILRAALRAFASIHAPGTILRLPHEWDGPWKSAEGGGGGDQRSVRSPTPEYQTEADRAAAVARFGEAVACEACAAADVPPG